MGEDVICRSQLLHYINTTPDAEKPTWSLLGEGISEEEISIMWPTCKTRKRFIKRLMGLGVCRNDANRAADFVRSFPGYSYTDAYNSISIRMN